MKQDFTLEDILEEQRQAREDAARQAGGERPLPPGVEYVEADPSDEAFVPAPAGEPLTPQTPEPVPAAPAPPAAPQAPEPSEPPEPSQGPEERQEEEPESRSKKKKKKRRSLFGWRKKVPDFDENEDDTYYGIQLKPIDEYRLDGDAPPLGEEGYKALFDDSKAIDDQVEENFQRLQRERRRRVAEAVQSAGMDEEQIADEFGVVAPMPVTPFAADPYARQHGLDLEGGGLSEVSDLQKAMMESSHTMEIKLNVLNSTVEIQKIREDQLAGQPVSDETVDKILASFPRPEPSAPQNPPVEQEAQADRPLQGEYPANQAEVSGEQAGEPDYSAGGYPEYQEVPAEEPEGYPEPAQGTGQPVDDPAGYPELSRQDHAPGEEAQRGSGELEELPEQVLPPESAYQEAPRPAPSGYAEEEAARQTPAVYTELPPQNQGPAPVYQEVPAASGQQAPRVPSGEKPAPEIGQTREMTQEELARLAQQAAQKGRHRQVPGEQPGKPAPPRPVQQVPYVDSIFQYRSRNIPTHIINADLLQSALLSETETLQQALEAAQARQAPRRRKSKRPPEEQREIQEALPPREESTESIEDYTGPEDARSISNELRGEMHELSLRMMITGVCTVLLLLVSLVCRSRFSPTGVNGSWPLAYVILTLVFLVVAVGMCFKTVGNGLKALFSAKANSDSGVAVAALAALVQTVASVFFRTQLVEDGLHLYAVVAAALLFVNTAGKLTMIRRIHSNFRFVTSREQKYGVQIFDDYNTSLKMTKDCVAEKPAVAYQCKAGFLKRFLELSYAPDPSEAASQLLAPLGLLSSLVLTVATLLISKSVPAAIGAFAAGCCACVAAGNMLSVNLPISRMCKTVRRAGGMAVGYEAVEHFGDVNAVIANADELFPTGTVTLHGIKTFGSRRIAEAAIVAASALMKEVGGPLSGVFDQVISENEEILPQVEKFGYETGAGIVGRVDGHTVYIGTRTLLINHRLETPSREEETQYASGNKNIIYIAVDAEVAALLVVAYTADRRRKNELQRLEDSGISVLVRTTDPNVTVGLVSRLFGVDSASVGILDAQLGDIAQRLTGEPQPRMDAVAATKGRMESMMSLIAACVEHKRTAGILVAIQTAAVVLGFVLVAFVSCFGAIRQLSAFVLLLFQLFWVGVLVILPRFRR